MDDVARRLFYDLRVPDRAWTATVPRLSGTSVDVREVNAGDAATLYELLSDPVVTEHLSSPPPSVEAFAGFIGWAQRERAAGSSVCFGIAPHGLEAAVGIIQIRALEPSFFTAEWGFAIGAAFWSTGIFVEAANLVAEFAFNTLNVHRLEARAVCQNGRGNGVLQKLGALPEATLNRSFRKNGRYDKQLLWTLAEDTWRERPLLDRRLSALEAAEQIAHAVQRTRRAFDQSRPRPIAPARAYPFFLTDSNG
jgi:ribosomal-protein-alanine N-acetyltransferase